MESWIDVDNAIAGAGRRAGTKAEEIMMLRALARELGQRLKDAEENARRVVAYLDPGRQPNAMHGGMAITHHWFARCREFERVRSILGVRAPESAPHEDVDTCRIPEPLATQPDGYNPSGWTAWTIIHRSLYRGQIEAKIWEVGPGLYAVYLGPLYLDSYDDLAEAKEAALAYVASM